MTDAEISAEWDAQASSLEDARRATGAHDHEMTRACLEQIQTWIPPSLERLRLLEIGCGIGRLTIPMAKVLPRSNVLGIDASPRMLEYAKDARKQAGIKNVGFMQSASPGPYGFGEGIFDGAWCVLTLQHISPELAREYVVAVGKALKPGGKFVFQYIPGEERQPFSNHFSPFDVMDWLHDGGLGVFDVAHEIGHQLWSWVCAVRR